VAKRTRKSDVVVRCDKELATPERKRQNGGITQYYEPDGPNSRVMILRHKAREATQIDRCHNLKWIDDGERDAGVKFRTAFIIYAEGVRGKDSTQVLMISGGSGSNVTDQKIAAKRVVDAAYAALEPLDRSIVKRVCGFDEKIYKEERHKLRRSLDILARLWGLA
jgi:hypothetical protein